MSDPPPKKPWTVGELLNWTTRDFQGRGIETGRLDAELLLAAALECSRVDLYLRFDQCPPEPALARFREAVKRRRNREPVAHILGRKSFHEIELLVRPGIFVPRPETELLVDEAVARLRTLGSRQTKVLDLCTGTGAVALAVLFSSPESVAYATDLDPAAGELARENAVRLGLADRFHFHGGDLFAPVRGGAPFDLITCNPPYVLSEELPRLMPEVRDHEPAAALDGGPDGLAVVRRMVAEAGEYLRSGGWLIFEIGEGQAESAAALARPPLVWETTRQDLRGIPRVVIMRKK